jgi:hypothetical protein
MAGNIENTGIYAYNLKFSYNIYCPKNGKIREIAKFIQILPFPWNFVYLYRNLRVQV